MVACHSLEFDGLWNAVGEIGFVSVLELQILAAIAWVSLGIVLFDESTSAAHQEQLHQFLPVLLTFASLKSFDASNEVLVPFVEFPFTAQLSDIGFRADTQVGIIIKEQTKLVAQITIVLVVRCSREQKYLAILLLDKVFDVLVADALIITQVMAFVNDN